MIPPKINNNSVLDSLFQTDIITNDIKTILQNIYRVLILMTIKNHSKLKLIKKLLGYVHVLYREVQIYFSDYLDILFLYMYL